MACTHEENITYMHMGIVVSVMLALDNVAIYFLNAGVYVEKRYMRSWRHTISPLVANGQNC